VIFTLGPGLFVMRRFWRFIFRIYYGQPFYGLYSGLVMAVVMSHQIAILPRPMSDLKISRISSGSFVNMLKSQGFDDLGFCNEVMGWYGLASNVLSYFSFVLFCSIWSSAPFILLSAGFFLIFRHGIYGYPNYSKYLTIMYKVKY